MSAGDPTACPYCDGDGYTDIVDDWGGVIGPQPCEHCDGTGTHAARLLDLCDGSRDCRATEHIHGCFAEPASAGSTEE